MRRSVLEGVALALGVAGLGAEPPFLSLAEARRRALAQNWDLLQARGEAEQAEAQRLIAREFPNPGLSLGASRFPTDGSSTRTALGSGYWSRSYDSSLSLSQFFELGGKRGLRQDSALEGRRAAELRLQDQRRTLDGAVTKAFVSAVLARENARQLERTAASLLRSAELAEARYRAGDISLAEKTQVELAAWRFQADAASAEAASRQARVVVDLLSGEARPTGAWEPREGLADLDPLAEGGPEAPSTEGRPDVGAAEAALRKARADLALQRAQRVPDLTLSFSYDHQPPDQRNTVGIAVGLTLPLWNRNGGAIASARASEALAKNDLARTEARARSERAALEAAFEAARRRRDRYRAELVPAADRVRDSVAFAYEKGAASYLELLEAERNANEVHLAAAQASGEALAAAVDLKVALNLPLPSDRP